MKISDYLDSIAEKPEHLFLEHVGHLLAIDRALLKRYPHQPHRRNRWLILPQPHLAGKAPLELMLVGGLQGIKEIRAILESDVKALRL